MGNLSRFLFSHHWAFIEPKAPNVHKVREGAADKPWWEFALATAQRGKKAASVCMQQAFQWHSIEGKKNALPWFSLHV